LFTLGRLRHWLRLPQAPNCRAGFFASEDLLGAPAPADQHSMQG